ncbi:hypothetical protein AMJ82_08380 [candidate division TA06 bacterium SM23_40]|uniref:Uncharacterized protein n=1 Tax=candidate division TA06 bacterium SM23_40 TaxID=1703774 RepID=A0A0S8G5S3_UNCT6|nr:MAG: hypothetical protein AMJ82_08380 [candidate division TA06 bacterium SM23_40]
MKRTALLLAPLAALVFGISIVAVPGALAGIASGDEALHLVLDQVLDNDTKGKRVFVSSECFSPGTPIHSWKGEIFTTDTYGWVVFIDDMAAANWEHPARYVFVERETGSLRVYHAMVPFRDEDGYREYPTEMQRLVLEAQQHRLSFEGLPKAPPRDVGINYAVLMSGGASMSNNHIRYWNDLSNLYIGLNVLYGYLDENIYVLCSDGLDPAPDRSNGTNSPPDLDGDGDDDIDYSCIKANIQLVFDELASIITPEDQLFVFTTDHGGSNSGWNVYLNLWNWEELQDWELRDMVDALPPCNMIFTMEQCYSGGFMDDVCWDHDGRVFSSACRYDEVSYASMNLEYDEYVFHWTAAVRWEDAYGNPVDADLNSDGLIDMEEAFIYAEAHDVRPETPQYDDRPEGLGALLTLFGGMQLGFIEGYVTDANTSLGLEAEVEVLGAGRGTSCDTSGYYHLVVEAETTYTLEASCFGYVSAQGSIFVPEGQTVQLDFALDPAATGTLEGTVTSTQTFLPIEGAEITILETPLDPVYTNAQGFYALDLPGGASYDVRASALGHEPQVAEAVYVAQGTTTTLDFALNPWPRILIWEADLSPVSGARQQEALAARGLGSIISTDLLTFGDLSYFDAVFVNVGIYPSNYVIPENSAEALAFETYIENGGNAYLEGGDVWYYDPMVGGHDFAPLFSINATADGSADLNSVAGQANTLMPGVGGMWFNYTGENNWIDHIMPISPAELVFSNAENSDPIAVANANSYGGHTLGASFEFGGLVDGSSTREALMAEIVEFFGLTLSLDLVPDAVTVHRGESLGFTANITNHGLTQQSIYGLGEVTLPSGNPYPGNPVDGPVLITLEPGETKTIYRSHIVPEIAPLGEYTYTGKLGLPPDNLLAEDEFHFIVEP